MEDVLRRFYTPGTPLYRILYTHSMAVAMKALHCIDTCNLDMDAEFVFDAAMLHDIGIIRTHAPSIHCEGSLPYICHGIEGARMLESLGLHRFARVAERHTGAGLTVADIVSQNLPLPHRDLLPETPEEKLICYADKFFSKSGDLKKEKSLDSVIASMAAHGPDTLERFLALHRQFGQ